MEQMKCPGQDTRYWKPGDIFVAECPKCGAEIEFFKDDTRRRCAWCGHLFYNPKIELGCAEWCQYAEKCVPDLVKAKKAAQNFKELLSEMVKSHLEDDPAAWERTAKGAAYAQDLLKAEGGDPKVVLAAVLLHRVAPDKAREFLAELDKMKLSLDYTSGEEITSAMSNCAKLDQATKTRLKMLLFK